MSKSSEAYSILKSVFGYNEFRGNQLQIIESVLNGSDGLVLMPTGGGKSLCYQIPALVFRGTTIVVSPLIALMKDQVDALINKGIEAAFLNSTLDLSEQRQIEAELISGHIKLLYISPERMMLERFQNVLKRCEISFIAIDEAHCVSQWGHDFRPEYQQLGVLCELFPHVPKLALTATAGVTTREDIIQSLKLNDPRLFIASFDRPNISYRIEKKRKKDENYQRLLNFINDNHSGESGIVYCLSRKKTEDTAKFLKNHGLKAYAYHAGMSSSKREKIQERFINKPSVVVVATIAFGMGIDKADVRFVAHMDLPKSMESYYQETGRAGRDGLPSEAFMLYGMQEVVMIKKMMNKGRIAAAVKRSNEQKLDAMVGLAESTTCRREVLLNYFNDNYTGPCHNCDICLDPSEDLVNVTQEAIWALQTIHEAKDSKGQGFDIHYYINMLTGLADGLIQGNNHHTLKVFSVGDDIKPVVWYSIFRQLISAGMIKMKMDGTSRLSLTLKALPVVRGDQQIYLRKNISSTSNIKPKTVKKKTAKKTAKKASKKKAKKKKTPKKEYTGAEPALFETLRELRAKLAKQKRTKPFKIFPDRTLEELIEFRPQSIDELESVYGLGPKRLKRYGQILIDAINEFD